MAGRLLFRSAVLKARSAIQKAISSITIMIIPHEGLKVVSLKIPAFALFMPVILIFGAGYLLCLAVNGYQYREQQRTMSEKIKFYSEQFRQWNSTLAGLKKAENKFRQMFALKSRDEIVQYAAASSPGSLDVPDLTSDLRKTIESVSMIKNYLRSQKDIYVAKPKGYPVDGEISSPYGGRSDPLSGEAAFHSGVDIRCSAGTPVRATADGVVSHSGWADQHGFTVVLEHGLGFTTLYAHNEVNTVKVGDRIKRGDIIGYSGSTGKSTGPHVHYEIWKDGKSVDPQQYIFGRT